MLQKPLKIPHFFLLLLCTFFFLQQGCSHSEEGGSADSLTDKKQDERGELFRKHIRTTEWKTPEEERAGFQLPPGFEITLFASEPDIGKPINMEFDASGRLWVTQSSEYPFAAEPGEGSDRITILEDTNRDGQADKFTNFVDTLNIPIGVMPIQEGTIAFSIPNISLFTDQDGDDKADDTNVLISGFGSEDVHGMVNNFIRGFDGWIYANHGFTNTSIATGTEGDTITMVSGNTFRFLPDGSRIELTTVGRVNPFGFAYDEWGYLYSVDCHSTPIYQLIRGAEYPSFGIRPEPNIGFGPRMMDYNLGPTAVSGLVYYTGEQFPEEYRNSFYSGNVASSRVNRNTVEFIGSTPVATRQEDFVISSDPWFRPVDFTTGPDGALYIADFYNRIIGHYEVPLDHPGRDRHSGRIWKITHRGDKEHEDNHQQDWSKATVDDLVQALNHPVLNTRLKISNELVERFQEEAIDPVREMMQTGEPDSQSYIQGLWILYRLNALSDELVSNAFQHPDPRVRVHALRVLAEKSELSARQQMQAINALKDENPHIKRAAAGVLSQFPSAGHVEPLLDMYAGIPDEDTHLRHTCLISILYQLKDADVMKEVASQQWREDQLSILMNVMPDVASEEVASFAFDYLQAYLPSPEELESFLPFIGRYLAINEMENLISFIRERFSDKPNIQYRFHQALRVGLVQRGEEPNSYFREWGIEMAGGLLEITADQKTEDIAARQVEATRLIEDYHVVSLESSLRELLAEPEAADTARAASVRALMSLSPDRNRTLVEEVLSNSNESLNLRKLVVQMLGASPSPSAFSILKDALKDAPKDLQISIAVELTSSPQGIDYLIRAMDEDDIHTDILSESSVKENLIANIQDKQQEQLEALPGWQTNREDRDQLIQTRLESFDPASVTVESGRAVFEQYCMMCHQVGDRGGLIGPQLDGIGNWGAKALSEKILDPNRNINESFQTHHITLANGRTRTGLFKREVGEVLVFANAGGEEFAVAKRDVEKRTVSETTLMPDYFGDVIDKKDFDALLKYLLSLQ